MLKLKRSGDESARIKGIQPEIVYASVVANLIWSQLFPGVDCVITSGTDGHAHKPESLHNAGMAIDLRIHNLPHPIMVNADEAVEKMKKALGYEYDIILESTHIHLEFDPKTNKEHDK